MSQIYPYNRNDEDQPVPDGQAAPLGDQPVPPAAGPNDPTVVIPPVPEEPASTLPYPPSDFAPVEPEPVQPPPPPPAEVDNLPSWLANDPAVSEVPESSPAPAPEPTIPEPPMRDWAASPPPSFAGQDRPDVPPVTPPPPPYGYERATPPPPPAGMPPAYNTPLSFQEEGTWAMLAHLSILLNLVTGFLGVIVPLVIYFIYKDRSRYVAHQSMQSFVFQLIWWVGAGFLAGIAWAISGALAAILIGCLLMPFALIISLVPLAALGYGIYAAIETSQHKDFKYWLIGDWARNF